MSTLNIVCLDLEGVLVPEIWIAFAEASGIPELKRTTRDEPDYDKLMRWRIGILNDHGLGLNEIRRTIETIEPMQMPMCSNGKGKLEPTCGRIRIRYRSSYADKVFEVEFHESGKTFILPDGTTREVEPQKAYGRNEY